MKLRIPPELNLYNCAACTLEKPNGPMRHVLFVVLQGPADAGQQKKDNDEPEVKVEEEDSTKKIEEKYELAIKNRKEKNDNRNQRYSSNNCEGRKRGGR